MMETILALDGIKKDFGEGDILKEISLQVYKGEFITLLGPSGCGKTTTLRVIAGLEEPTAGRVSLMGKDVTDLPPDKRSVNTVFQNYALFPHMNVEKNIGYGLRLRGVKRTDIKKKVDDMLEMLQLPGYQKRMPSQLSGGQRQRVAIARAIVLEPCVLLLDEPLGALDLQLRRQMQEELKKLQKHLGMTFVYITHDQEEALNMSDRIAVMREGRIEQLGTPEDIYERPATVFTAGFIGQTNLIACTVLDTAAVQICGVRVSACADGFSAGEQAVLSLRTERVRYTPALQGGLTGIVRERHYAGGTRRTVIRLSSGQDILAVSQSEGSDDAREGDCVAIHWKPDHAALVRGD